MQCSWCCKTKLTNLAFGTFLFLLTIYFLFSISSLYIRFCAANAIIQVNRTMKLHRMRTLLKPVKPQFSWQHIPYTHVHTNACIHLIPMEYVIHILFDQYSHLRFGFTSVSFKKKSMVLGKNSLACFPLRKIVFTQFYFISFSNPPWKCVKVTIIVSDKDILKIFNTRKNEIPADLRKCCKVEIIRLFSLYLRKNSIF